VTDLEVALPFWLDRPDDEAMDVALAASDAGFDAVWIGEMATYDAFALATAIGLRAPGMTLKIGPLAVGVRTPVGLALGASSVASLTGRGIRIDVVGRIDSKGGGMRATYEVLPDAPLTKFSLTLKGGEHGLLVNSDNLCKATAPATAKLAGQNNSGVILKPSVINPACKKKGKAKKKGKGK